MLPEDKMPEAEVTLRLAIAIIEEGHANSSVVAAIDGAQVKTRSADTFGIDNKGRNKSRAVTPSQIVLEPTSSFNCLALKNDIVVQSQIR